LIPERSECCLPVYQLKQSGGGLSKLQFRTNIPD